MDVDQRDDEFWRLRAYVVSTSIVNASMVACRAVSVTEFLMLLALLNVVVALVTLHFGFDFSRKTKKEKKNHQIQIRCTSKDANIALKKSTRETPKELTPRVSTRRLRGQRKRPRNPNAERQSHTANKKRSDPLQRKQIQQQLPVRAPRSSPLLLPSLLLLRNPSLLYPLHIR